MTGYEVAPPDVDPPILIPRAELVDLGAWLVPDSPLTYVWPLDQTLNLSGLEGRFRRGNPDLMVFTGVDGQDQPLRLVAMRRGPLMRLVGENDPGCCDFFHYRFDALLHLRPYADFNLDGRIDREDLERVMSNLGRPAGATFDEGDADGDGDVDGDDFLIWQRQIGLGMSMSELGDEALAAAMSAFAEGSATGVPEPGALLLAGMAAAWGAVVGRRRGPRRRARTTAEGA